MASVRLSRRQSLKGLATAGTLPWAASAAPRNPLPPVRLVILDVGGTIIQDRGDIPAELQRALGKRGIKATPEEIARWRGAAKREIVRHFVEQQPAAPGVDREKLIASIYEEFTARLIEIYRSVPPIQGAEAAIHQLRQSGYLVATTTGFDRAITDSIFRRLGWERNFAAVICSDDVKEGRPFPYMLFHAMEAAKVTSVAEVVAVGDTPLDLQAGSNAGLRAVVGVLTGAATEEKLRQEPHTHILPSVAQLPGLLASKI